VSHLIIAIKANALKEIKVNLALFDFDGTITNADMYSKFLRYSTTGARLIVGNVLLAPFVIMYKLGILPANKMRPIASFVAFYQKEHHALDVMGLDFTKQVIPQFIRSHALDKIRWHKDNGDHVVVVSASIDIYLKHWCNELGVMLICSELAVNNGKLSGFYTSGDCSEKMKSKRICERFNLDHYDCVYAYGDTAEDLDMLSIADEKYMNWVKVKD